MKRLEVIAVAILVAAVLIFGFTGCTTGQSAESNTEKKVQEATEAAVEEVQETEKAEESETTEKVEEESTQEENQLDETITVTDIAGREVVLEKPAEKIIDCTGLGGSRVLVQMEAEDLLVGITDRVETAVNGYGMFESVFHPIGYAAPQLGELPIIGTYNEPSIEIILSLEPDVILVGWGGKEQADLLQNQTGIPTVCINRMDGNFDYDIYEIVGKVIGREKEAQELITYLEDTMSVVTDITNTMSEDEKKSLFFWIYPTKEGSPRSNGVYDAFDYAGAINVASNDQGIALYEMTKEQIAAWDADFIFLQSYLHGDDNFFTVENIKDDPILKNTGAVKNGNVYYLRGPISDWDTAIEVAEVFYIAKLLYPDKFEDLDVDKICNEIFEKLYGVEDLYSQMRDYTKMTSWE